VDVEQDSGPLDQGPDENVSAEKVSLADEFPNREGNAERLGNNLTCHFLMICQRLIM
jgi:hypothetical protein